MLRGMRSASASCPHCRRATACSIGLSGRWHAADATSAALTTVVLHGGRRRSTPDVAIRATRCNRRRHLAERAACRIPTTIGGIRQGSEDFFCVSLRCGLCWMLGIRHESACMLPFSFHGYFSGSKKNLCHMSISPGDLLITVEDTGSSVDPRHAACIFEPFLQPNPTAWA